LIWTKISALSNSYIYLSFSLNNSSLKNSKFYDLLKAMMNVEELKLKLLYKASRDGFEYNDFHSRCNY
jgi:hypothetical protein